jgi:maleate isomerase
VRAHHRRHGKASYDIKPRHPRSLRRNGCTPIRIGDTYAAAYADRIPSHFHAQGYACVSQAHAGLSDNLSYCAVADADIAAIIRAVAVERPDAIIVYCTNFPAAHLVADLEAETGIAVYDSVSACVWKSLQLSGEPTALGSRWGSLFNDPRFA